MRGFCIKECEIVNVGSVDDLLLDLAVATRPLTALLAANGVGKTTALECLSLLGHLPCFPVDYADTSEPSLLRAALGETPFNAERIGKFLLQHPIQGQRIEGWLHSFRAASRVDVGAVRFVVSDIDGDDEGSTTYDSEFIILVQSREIDQTPTLTSLLSREHNDVLTPDKELDRHFRVLVFSTMQNSLSFLELLRRVARGRTYYLEDGKHFALSELPRFQELNFPASGQKRRVAYVNTDLNDFGRGNDLRESPKNIASSFSPEFASRIRIDFLDEDSRSYRYLGELNRLLAKTLSASAQIYGNPYAAIGTLQLQKFRLLEDAKIELQAHRGFGKHFSVEFFSAGENEVFFLLLMCQAVRTREGCRGILLLDEPDLHVANPMKMEFFRAILSTTSQDTQLVMCTHSAIALNALKREKASLRNHTRVIYRRFSDASAREAKLVVEYDSRFVSSMKNLSPNRWSPFTWISDIFLWLKGVWALPISRPGAREGIGQILAATSLTLFAGVVMILVIATLNDAFNVKTVETMNLIGFPVTIPVDNWIKSLLFSEDALKVHADVRAAAAGSGLGLLGLALVWLVARVKIWIIRLQIKRRVKQNAGS